MRRVLKGLITLALVFSFSVAPAADKGGCGTNCGTSSFGSSRGSGCDTGCDTGCGTSFGTCCGGSGCGNSSCDDCCQASACGYPFLAYRSQSWNAARQIAGIQPFINRYDMDSTYGNFSIALEYTRSFRPEHINSFLFGGDLVGCNSLLIQGSTVENRSSVAWLADYFGLPQDFSSCVSFCPRIENVIVDFDFYLGLDEVTEGLYVRLYAPLVWTRWCLRMGECLTDQGETEFPPGYMSEEKIDRANLPRSFTEAISGRTTWGDMKTPLCFGRMNPCCCTLTRLSDIQLVFGWNFVRDEDYNFGLNIRAGFPTGNRPCSRFLFEPIVGNGKHWELGGGLTSKYIVWRSEDNEDNYLGIYLDANFAHLFKTCQCRTFDFCGCRPNSRYMLLAEMGTNEDDLQGGPNARELTRANFQYQKNLIPATHFTTFNVDVRIDIQADIVLKFGYIRDNWAADLGFNLWARSGEKFCLNNCSCCGCPDDRIYAIKGDADLYGYFKVDEGNATNPIPLSSSQCAADIRTGQNMRLDNADDAMVNKGSDNPELAWAKDPAQELFVFNDTTESDNQIFTSIQPKLVSCDDVNFCRSPSAITYKVFGNFSYAWRDREENWTPYLGIGGEAEFAPRCNSCKFAVSQWGVWLKGGVAFE